MNQQRETKFLQFSWSTREYNFSGLSLGMCLFWRNCMDISWGVWGPPWMSRRDIIETCHGFLRASCIQKHQTHQNQTPDIPSMCWIWHALTKSMKMTLVAGGETSVEVQRGLAQSRGAHDCCEAQGRQTDTYLRCLGMGQKGFLKLRWLKTQLTKDQFFTHIWTKPQEMSKTTGYQGIRILNDCISVSFFSCLISPIISCWKREQLANHLPKKTTEGISV